MDELTRQFYEDNEGNPEAFAKAYGVDLVEPEETIESAKAVARFGWESLPGVGTYYTVQDITEELEQENPNYLKIGMLAGTEVIGLIPGIGDAAANLIKKGAKFKTKRGSVYTVEDESRTTRERAPDTPDGDFVRQPTSGKTIYMSYEDMNRFGPLFQKGEPGLYQFRPSGEGKAQLVFTKDYGPYKAGDPVPDTEVSFTLEPELGMNPVEIYDSTNNARTSIHFGNEIVEVESDIPKVPRSNPEVDKEYVASLAEDADVGAVESLGLTEEAIENWKAENYGKDKWRRPPLPEIEEAAEKLLAGELDSATFRRMSDELQPIVPIKEMPTMPTKQEVAFALETTDPRKNKKGIVGVNKEIRDGTPVSSRLDIPAYNNTNTWIVSLHDGINRNSTSGASLGYAQTAVLKDIQFTSNPLAAANIASGKAKTTIARIYGNWENADPQDVYNRAKGILNDPDSDWVQVGMNPYRASYFYDKADGMPVTFADEVIQVGPLVLAKNVKKTTPDDEMFTFTNKRTGATGTFNEGGMAMDEQMNAVFKSSRTGYAVGGSVDLDSVPDNTVGMDPVSGNEIPLGSLPEEVRDDIPAQLSEGEYVVPADVVRYYGVKFFEDLRAEAKFGYQDMEQNGRIGGEPAGMEMVEPEDDMMFDISELEVMEVSDEPVGAFFGGFFSKKEEKSPEEQVRERFGEVDKREKLKREAHQRALDMAAKDDNKSSSGPSIAEQINFGGDYEDVSSSSSKSKPKKESAASKTVRRAYTGREEPKQGVNLLENKPDAFGNLAKALGFADGGYALNPGDPGYEEQGSLGLGSEGIGLGSDIGEGSVVEMVAYINEEGRVIYILHIDGVPQNEIPPGFTRRTEEEDATEEDATDAQPAPQVVTQSDDDGGSIMPESTPIDYQNLTTDEMEDLLNDITDPKNKAIMLGIGAMMGPAGLLLKGAMMHQESQLRKEMERRLGGELTTQERARIETMYQQIEKKKGGIFGSLKGKVADLVIGPEQGPMMPETYTPEVAAGTTTGVADIDADAAVKEAMAYTAEPESVITTTELPDMTPFRDAGAEAAAAARKRVLEGKAVSTPPKMINEEYDSDQGRLSTQNQIFEARSRAREGTQDVLKTMRDRGAGRKERTAAVKEGARVESVMADQARGIKRGFKKGGLASKKKK